VKKFCYIAKSIVLIMLLVFSFVTAASTDVHAEEQSRKKRLNDLADILTDSEEESLSKLLDKISEKRQCDIIIVTVVIDESGVYYDEEEKATVVEAFSDSFFYANSFGQGENKDGIMLTISMSPRYYDILGNGYGDELMQNDRDYILDEMYDDMSSGNYYRACMTFAKECEASIVDDNTVGLFGFAVALGLGAVAALIVTGSMKAQLKSVALKRSAQGYVKPGSMKLTLQNDIFLYQTITRTARPKDTSSGGRSGGGGGSSHGGRSF
jgi:uncharacterized protein